MKKNFFYSLMICSISFLGYSQTQIGQDIIGEANNDQFGGTVSISADGSVVAIGAVFNSGNGSESGHVRVYSNQGGIWVQIGNDIDGEALGDISGFSVSLSADGNKVAIGAPFNDANGNLSGHVRIYINQAGSWLQIGDDIDGLMEFDVFGSSVSMSADGNIVAIGAPGNGTNGNESGQVRVYSNQDDSWVQVGTDINGQSEGDGFGETVSLSADGSVVAIGAPYSDINGTNRGYAKIYSNQGGIWTQIGNDLEGEVTGGLFSKSISLSSDGNVVAAGVPGNDSGYVRIYEIQSGTWVQKGVDISEPDLYFGWSVSLSGDGNIVAIGAIGDTNIHKGRVRVYRYQTGTWLQIGDDIEGTLVGDSFGNSVSLSSDGNTLSIGAPQFLNLGYVRVYDIIGLLSSDEFVLSQFSLYPNPAKNQFIIQLNKNLLLEKINIYNNLGQFVNSTQNPIVNTSKLSSGLYYVEVMTNKGKATKKLVIE